jgi:hypothetical protein
VSPPQKKKCAPMGTSHNKPKSKSKSPKAGIRSRRPKSEEPRRVSRGF